MENRWLKLHDFCSLWVLNSVVSYIFFVIFRTTTFFFPFISCLKVYLYLCSLIWFKVQTNWVMGRVIICLGIFVTETTSVRYEQDLSDSQFVFTICLFFCLFYFCFVSEITLCRVACLISVCKLMTKLCWWMFILSMKRSDNEILVDCLFTA